MSVACARGITSTCPTVAGKMSMIAIVSASSCTLVEGSSPAMIRQNRQSCMGSISHTRNYPAGVTDVTISIVSGGDADLLAACLASIPRAAREISVQIVVVDNRSGGALDP